MILALLLQAAAPTPALWAVTTQARGAGTAISTSAWSSDDSARLVVRCDIAAEKIVSIQFIPKKPFAPAQPRPVSFNADDNGWLGANWQFPGNGAFISDDLIVTNLSVVIAQARAIRVRVIDPADAVVEASFTGPGEAPVRKVLSACGYDLGVAPARPPVPAPAPGRPADPAEQ